MTEWQVANMHYDRGNKPSYMMKTKAARDNLWLRQHVLVNIIMIIVIYSFSRMETYYAIM